MLRTNCLLFLGFLWIVPRLVAASDPELNRLRSLRTDEFERQARDYIENVGTGLAPLVRVVEIHALAEARAASREFRKSAYDAVRKLLDGPDFPDRVTLREAVELWGLNLRNIHANRVKAATAEAIRRLASRMDYDDLREAFLQVSPANLGKPGDDPRDLNRIQRNLLFWILSDRWLELEIAKIEAEAPGTFQCPDFTGVVPERMNELSETSIASWKEAARFNAWQKAQPSGAVQEAGSELKREFADAGTPNIEAAVDRFFRNPNEVRLEDFSRFYWTSGFWCGTGGDGLRSVQTRMALMLSLRDRRIANAVALMLRDGPSSADFPASYSVPNWRTRLLRACGLDWEKLFTSLLLPRRESDYHDVIPCEYGTEMLVSYSSTVAARAVLETARTVVKNNERLEAGGGTTSAGTQRLQLQKRLVATFIESGDEVNGRVRSIDPQIQKELLDLLLQDVAREKNHINLANSFGLLARLQRPEVKEAIRPHLKSEFDYVAQNAALALRAMGEDIPYERPRPDPQFQLSLNGLPWKSEHGAYYLIRYRSKAEGWGENNFLTRSYARTQISFARDDVVRASDQMIEARFTIRPKPKAFGLLEAETSLAQPWLSVPLTLPISFDQVNEIHATTYPLEIRIDYPRPIKNSEGKLTRLELERVDENGQSAKEGDSSSIYRLQMRESYRFAALQPGNYRLSVLAPGAAPHDAGVVKVAKATALQVRLKAASELRLKLAVPKFEPEDRLPHVLIRALNPERWHGLPQLAKIYRDRVEVAGANGVFDSATQTICFSNIPPGRYTVRVLGVEDFAAEPGGLGELITESGEQASAAWKPREVSVEVRAGSPETIDLGEVSLERVDIKGFPRGK